MATRAPAFRDVVKRGAIRTGTFATAIMLGIGILLFALMLGSYSPSDPSMNTAAAGPARNLLGTPGAWIADGLLTLLGPAVALVIPLFIVAAVRLWRGNPTGGIGRRLGGVVGGIILINIALSLFRDGAVTGLPGGIGGVIGLTGADILRWSFGFIAAEQMQAWARYGAIALFAILGVIIWAKSLGIDAGERDWLFGRNRAGEDQAGDAVPVERPAVKIAEPAPRVIAPQENKPRPHIGDRLSAAAKPAKPAAPKQSSFDLKDRYVLPPLDLHLSAMPACSKPCLMISM
jgi:DNA segregation ATPase FtsK/SpoIIIE, S-DNA-T family